MGDKKGWRAFASDFLGTGEVPFESFQEHKATAVDEVPAVGLGNLHPSLASSGVQGIYDESGINSARLERMRVLQRKMQEQQRRYRRAQERRKQQDQEMAESWKQHVAEERDRKAVERQERLAALQEAQRRMQEANAQKQAAADAAEAKRKTEIAEAEAAEEQEAMSMFLTGLATPVNIKNRQTFTSTNGDANSTKKPGLEDTVPSDAEQSQLNKMRKPRIPTMNRKKKEEGVIETKEKTMVQQLPQLFPGLRRTAEGKKIQEEVTVEKPSHSSRAEGEHTMRRAQLGLMKRIASQVLDYRLSVRSSLKTRPIRLIEVVPTST
eukprot:gnl/MRDRNA2_/MRDRNA2_33992_c0_seq1.p1 gnl/MRDRNA2_/MRDRNA2_33992_c0~~gnl/MRDRNA2_/MRDRNA2_33992_c0_seq1.p1  ORF type:complete len:323 (+),score=92.54 gnl/MRDRNA2_/MRDRNA2_33992_c0_seq1:166-1134(+)